MRFTTEDEKLQLNSAAFAAFCVSVCIHHMASLSGKGEAPHVEILATQTTAAASGSRLTVDLRDSDMDDDVPEGGDVEAAQATGSAATDASIGSRSSGPLQANKRLLCACGKTSGFPNTFDEKFHTDLAAQFVQTRRRENDNSCTMRFWFEPRFTSYTPDRAIPLDALCTKPVFVWCPDVQFKAALHLTCDVKTCGSNGKPCKFYFSDFPRARYVHTRSGGAFLLAARYRCSVCKTKVAASSESALRQLPPLWQTMFPFLLLSKTAFDESFLSDLLLLAPVVGVARLTNVISRWRHDCYHRVRYQYLLSQQAVVESAKARKQQADASKQPSLFRFHGFTASSRQRELIPFPGFGQHCDGYNEILAPDDQALMEALEAYVEKLELINYADRFMCALTGKALSSDQSYKVASRIRALDPRTATKDQPAVGMVALTNEYGQVMDFYWTQSSSHNELGSLAELVKSRGVNPIMWTTDLCCKVGRLVGLFGPCNVLCFDLKSVDQRRTAV